MSDAVTAFVAEARQFCAWVRDGRDSGEAAAREALVRITALYSRALSLPSPYSLDDGAAKVDKGTSQTSDVYATIGRRLPFQYYSEVFDPLSVPPESDPVIGDLTDDIGDIHSHIASGLTAFDRGDLDGAVWEWGFGLIFHWGEHATGAIRALHCFLTQNLSDGIFGRVPPSNAS